MQPPEDELQQEEDGTIQYNTIQYNTIQYNTIQYNTIQYKESGRCSMICWCLASLDCAPTHNLASPAVSTTMTTNQPVLARHVQPEPGDRVRELSYRSIGLCCASHLTPAGALCSLAATCRARQLAFHSGTKQINP